MTDRSIEGHMPDERWGASTHRLLGRAADLARDYLASLPERHVGWTASADQLRSALQRPLSPAGEPADRVIAELVDDIDGGLVASSGPRYFGFVIGGGVPAAVAADWLTAVWDQNAGGYAVSPASSVIEEVVAAWVLELMGLPATASVGFTTGCQMANFTGLAAGRHAVLQRVGWDVEADGLQGAPPITVLAGEECHVTIRLALQMLGLGNDRFRRVPVDGQGRMRPDALRELLAETDGPTIVAAQLGNVNTGACDPMGPIVQAVRDHDNAWLHVDGAFGLWAAAEPSRMHLTDGMVGADSWATDAHKWLNVPYDCGITIVRHREAHQAAMMLQASYLMQHVGDTRDPSDFVPDFSRRARGIPLYAALRTLGRDGVTGIVDRCCAIASRMAERLSREPGVAILNEVVLNQVLVRFADDDRVTDEVVRRVQEDGTCWASGSRWRERAVMRISVSNWATTEEDADRSVEAMLSCFAAARGLARAASR